MALKFSYLILQLMKLTFVLNFPLLFKISIEERKNNLDLEPRPPVLFQAQDLTGRHGTPSLASSRSISSFAPF